MLGRLALLGLAALSLAACDGAGTPPASGTDAAMGAAAGAVAGTVIGNALSRPAVPRYSAPPPVYVDRRPVYVTKRVYKTTVIRSRR